MIGLDSLQDKEQVDVALLLFNTMLHLHSNHDARDCLQCIFDSLKPGGLLILELPPVREIFDGSLVNGIFWEEPVEGQEDIQLITEYGTDDDEFDPESQVGAPHGLPCCQVAHSVRQQNTRAIIL